MQAESSTAYSPIIRILRTLKTQGRQGQQLNMIQYPQAREQVKHRTGRDKPLAYIGLTSIKWRKPEVASRNPEMHARHKGKNYGKKCH